MMMRITILLSILLISVLHSEALRIRRADYDQNTDAINDDDELLMPHSLAKNYLCKFYSISIDDVWHALRFSRSPIESS